MELPLAAGLGILAAILVTQGFLAASEIGLLAVSKAQAAQLRAAGRRAAGVLYGLLDSPTLVLSVILVGITTCTYISETLATLLADEHLGRYGLAPQYTHAIAFVSVALVWLVFAEVTPILFAIRDPERMALLAAVPLRLLSIVLWPVVTALTAAAGAVTWALKGFKRAAVPSLTEEHLKEMIELTEEDGALEAGEKRMLHGVFHFADALVDQVMVPRVDMVCVEARRPLREALSTMVEVKHSRLPVYEDTIDNIVGILYAKDLLPHLREGRMNEPCGPAARPALRIPESKKVSDLLADLQRLRRAMAIVVDEYGGVAGLVTVEDLLEEIVGEIMDEYDVAGANVIEIGVNEYLCDGAASIYELNRHLRSPIPPTDFESVSGLVYDCLGRVPEAGERCEYRGLRLTVEKVDNRRIEQVRIVEASLPAKAEPKGEGDHA